MRVVCAIDDVQVGIPGTDAYHVVHLTTIVRDIRMQLEIKISSKILGELIASELRKEVTTLLTSRPIPSLVPKERLECIDLVLIWPDLNDRPRRLQKAIQSDTL